MFYGFNFLMWPKFRNFGRAVISYNVAKFVISYDTTK